MPIYWLKKVLVFFIVVLFIGASVVPVINGQDFQDNYDVLERNLGINVLQGNILLDYDSSDIPDTIDPLTEQVSIPISVD